MKTKKYIKIVMLSVFLFPFSMPVISGPGGGAGTGGPGIIPGGGQEMRSIELSDMPEIRYANPQMPVIDFRATSPGDGIGGIGGGYVQNELLDRMTEEQVEMIYELMDSGALEKLEFQFRDGSRMMLRQ